MVFRNGIVFITVVIPLPCLNFTWVLKFWKRDYWFKKKKKLISKYCSRTSYSSLNDAVHECLHWSALQVACGVWGQAAGSTIPPLLCVSCCRTRSSSHLCPSSLEKKSYWVSVPLYLTAFSLPSILQMILPKFNGSILTNAPWNWSLKLNF